MAEVFISYSQKERERVAPIAARLAELGVEAWFDREISAGESFGRVIREKLKEAKAVLVCWSPEAIQSQWVDAEADYAREANNYVPVFVAPCALMPPFNRIHTDDLSGWNGSASDPTWLKLVERIAKLLGRDGVAAAARAFAVNDDRTLYEFAKRYPDEPSARIVWSNAEARHRKEFESRLEEARTAAAARAARITAEASDLESRIEATAPAFEAWLADERRGAATEPKPDPLPLVKRYVPAEERKLRDEVAALSNALAQAKAIEEELEAAKAEVTSLSKQSEAATSELRVLREQNATLSTASATANALEGNLATAKAEIGRLREDLAARDNDAERLRAENAALSADSAELLKGWDAAKAETARLSRDLAAARESARSFGDRRLSWSRASALLAITAVVAAVAGALAMTNSVKTASALQTQIQILFTALGASRDEATKLRADLESSRSQAQTSAERVQALSAELASTRDRAKKVQEDLDTSRSQAQSANGQLASAPDQATKVPDSPNSGHSQTQGATGLPNGGWIVVVDREYSIDTARYSAEQFKVKCARYGSNLRLLEQSTDWRIVVGPYSNYADAVGTLSRIQNCYGYSEMRSIEQIGSETKYQ